MVEFLSEIFDNENAHAVRLELVVEWLLLAGRLQNLITILELILWSCICALYNLISLYFEAIQLYHLQCVNLFIHKESMDGIEHSLSAH